jgi:hypothetical protein
MQVTVVSGLDQSGLLRSQSVVTFRAVGPTTNCKTVLQNCRDHTASRLLGLRDSKAQSEVKKSTDTWFPNDAVKIQKADCAAVAEPARSGYVHLCCTGCQCIHPLQ